MADSVKIGIVIADADEFLPLENIMPELCGRQTAIAGRKAYVFNVGSAEVTAVLCGIGKVNAAVAAAALAENGAEILLNCGLSGGISGVRRGEICIPNRFLEHDFDLTGIGYKPCEKPLQEYIYYADKELVELLRYLMPLAKTGTAVSGDRFVSDTKLRDSLKKEFSAMSCDMETAAIAYVAHTYGVKFASIRKISDDAGNYAAEDYRELNIQAENVLIIALLELIEQITSF